MGQPKQHHSHGKVGRRRANLGLKSSNLGLCSKCGSAKKPHSYCPTCGTYKDKKVVDVLAGLSKKAKKEKEKEIN